MKLVDSKQLCRLALCLAATLLSVEASAAVYEMRIAAPGLKSPLVNPILTEESSWTVVYGAESMLVPAPSSTSNGAFTFTSGAPNVATIDGNVITFAGAGTATITAVQAATATYNAGQATISLTVQKAAPALQSFNISPKTSADGTFTLPTLSSTSPGAISYTSSNPAVATVSGAIVTIRGEGSTTITASQAGTANFTVVTQSAILVVSAPPLPAGYVKIGTLTWTPISTVTFTYDRAVTYCSGTFNGQTGWRLSTYQEMSRATSMTNTYASENTWNEKWGTTYYYSQVGAGGNFGYTSSHGLFQLRVFCVK